MVEEIQPFRCEVPDAVLEDIPPLAAKTGALGSAEMVEAVARAAERFSFPLVVDPVMVSKHGLPLLPEAAVSAVRDLLLPRAALITPNVPEAEGLEDKGPLPRGSYRVLSRNANGSQIYKNTGFKGYILAPIDSTPYNDRYDAFGRGSFRMHYGQGVGCLTTCVPRDFARLQSFLERAGTVSQPSVSGWGTQRFYGVLDVNTSIHGY